MGLIPLFSKGKRLGIHKVWLQESQLDLLRLLLCAAVSNYCAAAAAAFDLDDIIERRFCC
jgi:hypothetical protein